MIIRRVDIRPKSLVFFNTIPKVNRAIPVKSIHFIFILNSIQKAINTQFSDNKNTDSQKKTHDNSHALKRNNFN